MQHQFDITKNILECTARIAEKLGKLPHSFLHLDSFENRALFEKEVCISTLYLDQIKVQATDVIALLQYRQPEEESLVNLAAYNTLKTYRRIDHFDPFSKSSLFQAHRFFAAGLDREAGELRKKNVVFEKGRTATHVSPPPHLIEYLLEEHFRNRSKFNNLPIIEACLAYYDLTLIEPFTYANGRLSRFWWKLNLLHIHPVFRELNLESILLKNLNGFIESLVKSSKEGNASHFLEFCLSQLDLTLEDYIRTREELKTADQRILSFIQTQKAPFTRKDYLKSFNYLSTATATRDLCKGVEEGLLLREGFKKSTFYKPVLSKPSNSA